MRQILSPPHLWWWGAALGLLIALIILCALGSLDLFDSSTSLGSAFSYFLTKLSKFLLIGFGVVLLLSILEKIPFIFKCLLIGFGYAIYYFFIPVQTKYGIALIALWGLISVSFTGGGLLSLLSKSKQDTPANKTKAWISLIIGICSLLTLIGWMWITTQPFTPPKLTLGHKTENTISLSNPSLNGSFTYKEMFYGSGKDLHRLEFGSQTQILTEPVDGSPFIDNWNGFTGWLRSLYWGFDPSKLPLNGHVWMPENKGPFPLIIIVHGNHEMMTPSDEGYAYLGALLASRGFLTVTIDENFLNGSWLNFSGGISEVPARGWLLLEHLKQWRSWNQTATSPFYGKVDMDNIGLIGHSRGGEAIAVAAAFNQLSNFPGDGNIAFDYGFGIKALAAISPVDAQYKPGGLKTELENIDYFVLHGSHDGDVRSFEGSAQYHRVHFSGTEYHFKAALYIYGANHGQFNTLWGKKDDSSPATILFDMAQIMPEKEQQRIAKVYLSGFFETTLHRKKGYLPMFQSYRNIENWLPKTLYLNEFADSTFQYIDDDKDGIDLSKTSFQGVQRTGENLDEWKQTLVSLKKGHPLRPATYMSWSSYNTETLPSYTITLPSQTVTTNASSTLVFSLANAEDNIAKNNKINDKQSIDFTIELIDDEGQSASLPLSSYAYLAPPLLVKMMKASFLDPLSKPEKVFQTFEYPLSTFVDKNPLFDPQHLHTIRFIFDKSSEGKIILDTVAFKSN